VGGIDLLSLDNWEIVGYGNSTNSVPWRSFFVVLCPIRAISVIRGQNFRCGGAALGNPRLPLMNYLQSKPEKIFEEKQDFEV
jgi:hypothetical protein